MTTRTHSLWERKRSASILLVFAAIGCVWIASPASTTPLPSSGSAPGALGDELRFVPNRGQTDARVRYYARGAGYAFFFTTNQVVMRLDRGGRAQVIALRMRGADTARIDAARRAPEAVNHLTVGAPRALGLPAYEEIVYRGVWPGIDVAFRGEGGVLKYEFRLSASARVGDIHLSYAGATSLAVGAGGSLRVGTPAGTLRDGRPRSYQRVAGRRVPVASRYSVDHGRNSFGFALGARDRSRPVVIDPGIAYSTYVGGETDDRVEDVVVSESGHAFVAGTTSALDFPTTPGAFDESRNGGNDVFVAKLAPDGTDLVYATYVGGSGFDYGRSIAVDDTGSAYVTGYTDSPDFPTTAGALKTTLGGPSDSYALKLTPDGSSLAYSTYLGGSARDGDEADVAVDEGGNAYVGGWTFSTDFPVIPGAFDATHDGGPLDAYVVKLSPSGSLLRSTFLGGTDSDLVRDIELGEDGRVYVTGTTESGDFPTTPSAFDRTYAGGVSGDAFVATLDGDVSTLGYSTYIGGGEGLASDFGHGIAVDGEGSAYVGGTTLSPDFPVTPGAFDSTLGGFSDAFVLKLDAAGTALVYATFLGGDDPVPGGQGDDVGLDVAVDAMGHAYVTGSAFTTDFPVTPDAFDSGNPYFDSDAFLTQMTPAGSGLVYSTYLGTFGRDNAVTVALDPSADAYVGGSTDSTGFPITPTAADRTNEGGLGDGFVTKFDLNGPGLPARLVLEPQSATNVVDTEHCVTATARDLVGNPTPGIVVRFSVTGAAAAAGSATTDAGGEARFCYAGPALAGEDSIDAHADTDQDSERDPGEPVGTASKHWELPASTPGCEIRNQGRITTASGAAATFSGIAQAGSDGSPRGRELYQQHGGNDRVRIRSSQIVAVVCDATRRSASVFGESVVNGGQAGFRIEVTDGNRRDQTYRMRLESGYDSGVAELRGGNVRIRSR